MNDDERAHIEKMCADREADRMIEVRAALNRLGMATKCGNAVCGCRKEFGSCDVHKLTRCIDCGLWFHEHCARRHFAESRDEKDARIAELEASILLPGSPGPNDSPGMTNEENKRRVREARRALRESICTCKPFDRVVCDEDGRHTVSVVEHDEYDVTCERTMAEIAFDEALTIAGLHP